MNSFSIHIHPQYVKITDEIEQIDGKLCHLHEVQKRIKLDFTELPEFTIITAPTGTGKSYAFPFPVLNSKSQTKGIDVIDGIRGLIVLPTNALISELTDSFKKTYPQLTINQLTGPELNKHDVRGLDRWKKAIEIAETSDLIITNPDIINYAMHGGYHQWSKSNKTGATRFSRFLSAFSYIIFDEYHLYDEAQIANILTMAKLREYFLKHETVKRGSLRGVRMLFVSATPEEGLKNMLEREGYEYEEIVEEIVNDPTQARPIHGQLEVEFVDNKDIKSLVREKIPELREMLKSKKALLILNNLRAVQELADELRLRFPEYTIYESTGYVSKEELHNKKIKAAHLILATNKAEVGVNYDVEYCIMQPGKYFQNFVQRFGRVSRGDLEGKVVVGIKQYYNKIKRGFKGKDSVNYYGFIEKMRNYMQGRKFYTERVPMYVGEYLWCISNRIRRHQEFDISRYLKRRMSEDGFFQSKESWRYYQFEAIHKKICQMMAIALKKENISQTHWDSEVEVLQKRAKRTWEWANWWRNYLDTYLTFRDGSKVVRIYDRKKDEYLEYSLDWILQHKIIEKVETIQTKPYEIIQYTVGDFKDQDKELQYVVTTIPNAGIQGNNYLSYSEIFELTKVFKRAVDRIYDKVIKGVGEIEQLQIELLKEVEHLAISFDRKRLHIESIENDDNIL